MVRAGHSGGLSAGDQAREVLHCPSGGVNGGSNAKKKKGAGSLCLQAPDRRSGSASFKNLIDASTFREFPKHRKIDQTKNLDSRFRGNDRKTKAFCAARYSAYIPAPTMMSSPLGSLAFLT